MKLKSVGELKNNGFEIKYVSSDNQYMFIKKDGLEVGFRTYKEEYPCLLINGKTINKSLIELFPEAFDTVNG